MTDATRLPEGMVSAEECVNAAYKDWDTRWQMHGVHVASVPEVLTEALVSRDAAWQARVAEVEKERDEARAFGERAATAHNDLLLNGPLTVCVWCGHEFPKDTPAAKADVLYAHALECEKHPLRASEAALAASQASERELREALEDAFPSLTEAPAEKRKWFARKDALLSRAPGGTDALKTFGVRCAERALYAVDHGEGDGVCVGEGIRLDIAHKVVAHVLGEKEGE